MDEWVINDLYERAKSKGYKKSLDEFKTLLYTDQGVFDDMYGYVQSKGYKKGTEEFSTLIGKTQSAQQPTQQPTVKKKDDGGISESEPSKTEQGTDLFSRAQFALGIKQPQQEQVGEYDPNAYIEGVFKPKEPVIYSKPEIPFRNVEGGYADVQNELAIIDKKIAESSPYEASLLVLDRNKLLLRKKEIEDSPVRASDNRPFDITAPKFLEDGLNALTPKQLASYGAKGAKETFDYYFKDAGFKFETDREYVRAISPDGKVYTYNTILPSRESLDEFKNFVRESAFNNPEIADKAYLYEKENKKFKTKEEINNEVKTINAQEEGFMGDYKKFLNLQRDINEIEADLKRFRDSGEQNTPKYIQTEAYLNERKKELQDYAGTMDSKLVDLKAQRTQLDKAVGRYTEFQATQGDFGGNLYRSIANTTSGIFSNYLRLAVTKSVDFMPLSSVMGEEAYQSALDKKLKEKGYEGNVVPIDVLKEAKAEIEAEIGSKARDDFKKAAITGKYQGEQLNNVLTVNGVRESLSEFMNKPITSTKEYLQERQEKGSFIERGLLGFAGSLPAMVGGPALRYMNMFMMTTDGALQEMDNNPNFADVSENEKELVALPIGVVGAVLEEFGLKNLKLGKSITSSILKTVLGRVPANATASTIRKTTFDVLAERGIRAGTAYAGGILSEMETGLLQQANDYAVKDIYSAMKEKKMFDNPAFLTGQYLYDLWDASRTEGVGAGVMSVPYSIAAAYQKDGFQALDDATFKIFEDLAKDNDSRKFFVTSLKNKINLGEVTPTQGKQMLEAYDQASGMIGRVPDEITDPESRKIAMDLISERKKLEGKKEKYDDALAKPIQDKINQINEQLTQLTEDAIQKQAASEVSLQPETEPGKEVEAGGPEAGPKATPKQGVLSPEEEEKLRNNRRVDLFPEESEFADVIGGSGRNSSLSNYSEVNGVGVASYTNPDNGLVDVIMSGTSDNDYVGYVRVYENGKPTNRWTSKMSNESGNKDNFKTMISEVQSRLPENHEYTESTNISIDGVRVYSNQLNRGYEVLTDANGNPVTNTVTLNAASVEGLQQAATQEEKQSLYDNMTVTTREQFNALRDKITALMPNVKVLWNQANNTVQIQLPVLVQSKKATATETTPAQKTFEQRKSEIEKITDPEQRKVAEIEFILSNLASGVGEASANKIREYADRIISGKETRDQVIQGLPKSFVDGIDQLLAAQQAPATTETTAAEVTPAEQQFTEQDRARKAELEEAMRKADKRRKNITVGETTMPKAEAKAELDALNQKEQATQQPVTPTATAPTATAPVETMTAEQEADLLEELMTGKKKETAPTETAPAEPTSKEAIAKRLRGKKNKGLMSSIDFGISQALYNGALEFMASQVEKGTKLGNAIENTIKWIDEKMQGKSWDKDGFTKYANTTFEEVATKKKAKAILDVYPKGSVVGIADLARESGDTIISNVLSKMKDVFNKVKISGRRPTEGAAFYNYNTKEIDVNKNSPHWDEVEGDQIASALSHEFAHHLIDGHSEKEAIETDLQEIKDDLIANKPELTESQKKAYEFMTSKNNSPQEILTYAVSDPDIRPILTKYKDKLNNISNKLFGEDVISGIFEEQKSKTNEIQPQRTRDGRGRTESRAIAPLEGAPSVQGFVGPDPQLTAVAEEYAKENGIPYKRQAEYVKVDEDRAKRIAEAYEEMKHDPQNPKVKEAYENLIKQTIAQYEALVKAGYKFWFIDTNIPSNLEYAQSPFNAMRDVRSNKQMGVFPTTDGFGSSDIDVSDNPMMVETKFKWPVGGMDGELKPVLANDLFRAVHDAFGHGLEGAGFRARGEENAWQAHIRLFTGSAVGAITSETRGQNSWLNFGPHGEKNRTANTDETIFADQKTGLMPEWTWKEGVAADMETTAKPFATSLADAVRKNLTIKTGGLQSNILGVPIAIWNAGVQTVAKSIEVGMSISGAIKRGINYIKEKHGKKFNEASVEKKMLIGLYSGAIQTAREAGITNEGLKTYLTRKGATEEQIEALLKYKERAEKKPISKGKITGKPKPKKVTVNEMTALKDQIKLEAKAAREGAKSVSDAVKSITEYFNSIKDRGNLTRKDIIKILGIISKVNSQKTLDNAANKIFEIIEKAKSDVIEVSEYKALKDQLRLEAKAAREAKGDLNAKRKMLTAAIKKLADKGSITVRQAKALINRVNAVNLDNPVMVERMLDYAEKVFNDAAYAEKLSQANKLQSQIKQLSKNKDKFGNLTPFAAEFAKIDPAMVENIDEYLEMASKVKEGVQGSKIVGDKVIPADMVDVGATMEYVNKTMEAQEEAIRLKTAERLQELMGVDVSDLTYDQMMELLDTPTDKKVDKYKEGIIRGFIDRMFNTYSTIIKDMFETGIDPFSDPENPTTVDFKDSDKKIVEEFMAMDLSLLDAKEALRAADALNNFLTNKSTAGMLATLGDYNGRKNIKEVADKNIKAHRIKMYWSPILGRTFFQQISSIPAFFERLFKSYKTGRYIREMMGINSLINHKQDAVAAVNRIINNYILEFSKKTPNNKNFQDISNIIERDIIGSLGKTIVGNAKQVEAEFNRRKKLIEQSIQVLEESGTKKELELAKTMKEVYDKIAKDSKTIEDVKSKADKINVDAVQFWINTWANVYDQLADVTLNVYNRVLDKNVNFVPDRFGFVESANKKSKDADGFGSTFLANSNSEYFYKKEAGSLMKSTPPQSLLDEDGESKGMYVDMSFDTKNANALMDALIDIKTAADIRQIQAFKNDSKFKKIFPFAEDANVTKERIAALIRNFRNKRAITDKSLKDLARKIDRIAAIGTSLLLAGPTQAISQTIPVAINTIVNTKGKVNLSNINNKDVNRFIDESGMGIANRGSDAVTELESLNQKLEVAAKTKGGKLTQYIENLNRTYLKVYLSNFDVFIARASWIAYYEKGLRKQGIKGKVDYSKDKLNKEAAQYAQDMIDRQQNISDKDLAGQLYHSDVTWKQLIVKIVMPLATFRMNQTTRFSNDLAILSSKTASTEEKKEAAISLGGFAAEMATFRAIKLYIGYYVFYSLAQFIRGEEDDEEEKQKTWDNMKKGAATSVVSDVFSPIPMTDVPTKILFAGVLDQLQNIAGIGEDDKFNIFTESKSSFTSDWGLLGVGVDKMIKLGEKVELARTGKFKDDFGNEKTISESDRALLSNPLYIGINVATVLGINPFAPETDNVMNRITKMAKKNAMSNEQLKEAEELGVEGKKDLMKVKAEDKSQKEEAYGNYKTLEEFEEKDPIKYDEYSAKGGKLYKYREKERLEFEEKNKDKPFFGHSEEKFKELYPKEWAKKYGPGTAYFQKQNSPAMLQKKAQEKMREAQREQKRKMAEAKRRQQEILKKASGK